MLEIALSILIIAKAYYIYALATKILKEANRFG